MKVADLVRKVTVKALCWRNFCIFPVPRFPGFTTEAVHHGCYVCRLSAPAGDPSYLHSFSSSEAVIIIRCQLCADTEFYFVFFCARVGSTILASAPYTVIPWVTALTSAPRTTNRAPPAPRGSGYLWKFQNLLIVDNQQCSPALCSSPGGGLSSQRTLIMRTREPQFHLSLSCKVGTSKLSLRRTQCDVQMGLFPLASEGEEQDSWSPLLVGPSSFLSARNAFMIHIKLEVMFWVVWITRGRLWGPWERPPEGCES